VESITSLFDDKIKPEKVKVFRKNRKQRKLLIKSLLLTLDKVGFEIQAQGKHLYARLKDQVESYLVLEYIEQNAKKLAHYQISFYRQGKLVSCENIKNNEALKIQKAFQKRMVKTLPDKNPQDVLTSEINSLFHEADEKRLQKIRQENLEFLVTRK